MTYRPEPPEEVPLGRTEAEAARIRALPAHVREAVAECHRAQLAAGRDRVISPPRSSQPLRLSNGVVYVSRDTRRAWLGWAILGVIVLGAFALTSGLARSSPAWTLGAVACAVLAAVMGILVLREDRRSRQGLPPWVRTSGLYLFADELLFVGPDRADLIPRADVLRIQAPVGASLSTLVVARLPDGRTHHFETEAPLSAARAMAGR